MSRRNLNWKKKTRKRSQLTILRQYLKDTPSLNQTPLPGVRPNIKEKAINRLFLLAKIGIT